MPFSTAGICVCICCFCACCCWPWGWCGWDIWVSHVANASYKSGSISQSKFIICMICSLDTLSNWAWTWSMISRDISPSRGLQRKENLLYPFFPSFWYLSYIFFFYVLTSLYKSSLMETLIALLKLYLGSMPICWLEGLSTEKSTSVKLSGWLTHLAALPWRWS